MAFTSKITFATNIVTGANATADQRQGARGHATIHNNIGSILNSLQDKVGVDNSSDTSSLDYIVNNKLNTTTDRFDGELTFVQDQTLAFIKAFDGINSNQRIEILGSGQVSWGPGTGLLDTSLYRNGSGSLRTDGTLSANVLGVGTTSPGEKITIAEGNLLFDSSSEQELRMIHTGLSNNPRFKLGRISNGGDGDPGFRFLYQDDATSEIPVLIADKKGIIASVKPEVGTHFEGFINGDEYPLFRLASHASGTRLELGAGGSSDTDVMIYRQAANQLRTDNELIAGGQVVFGGDLRVYNQTNKIFFSSTGGAYDVNIYANSSGRLVTDDTFECADIRINKAPTVESVTSDATLTINVNGTNYKVLLKS